MQINTNNYSVLEILNMLERRELMVNRDYQRGSGLWPAGPSSYFIETILEGYPFPKIYMYEFLARPGRELRKEMFAGIRRLMGPRDKPVDDISGLREPTPVPGTSRFARLLLLTPTYSARRRRR